MVIICCSGENQIVIEEPRRFLYKIHVGSIKNNTQKRYDGITRTQLRGDNCRVLNIDISG